MPTLELLRADNSKTAAPNGADRLSCIPEVCFPQLFEAQVERTPDAEAVAYRGQRLTYRDLNRRANRLARHLREFGVGPEKLVAVCMERAPQMMVALLGILKTGAAYLPLDPSYPNDRLAYMLEDAHTSVILTQERLLDKFSSHPAKSICLDERGFALTGYSEENLAVGIEPDNLAYVLYTSGSTGKPKGVMIHHGGLANYLRWASRFYRVAEGHGTLVHSPIGFDLTITTLFAPLLVGQRVVLLPEGVGIEELIGALRAGMDFSIVKITPTHLEALGHVLAAERLAGRVRVLVIGGEMLRWEHISAWRRYAPATRIINEYGPTETVVGCCIYEVTDETVTSGSVPIGRAIDNMEMHVLGADLQPVAAGETGEVYISGVGLARGYLNQPETTAAKFIWRAFNGTPALRLYKTGDLARALPDGNLEYLGRTDHQVKVRGYRIELGEIEVALAQHPKVRDCVVVAREDSAGPSTGLRTGQRLVAYVVGKNGAAPAVDHLRTFLQERLPEYMVPSAFVALDALPLTVNGKVDRDALPAPEQFRPRLEQHSFEAPTDPLEIQLTEVWEEVLGIHPVGVNDNFFELGGDSLKAVLMATKIEEIRGRHIPPSLLLEQNTIEKLARAIHRLELEPCESVVVPIQPKGHLSPLYLVSGLGGLVLGFSYLGQHVGKDQPLYGLQASGVKDSESILTSVEEMAAYYLSAIQAVQPDDPLFIGGYSFGGIVAFEMARQLYAAGKRVGILAILDTIAPGSQALKLSNFIRNLPYRTADFLSHRGPREIVSGFFRKAKSLAKTVINLAVRPLGFAPVKRTIEDDVEMPPGLPERYHRILAVHYEALLKYRPGKYAGPITLFRTKSQPLFKAYGPDNGWGRLAEGGVEVYRIGGNHMNFVQEPHVQSLVKQLRTALESAGKKCESELERPRLIKEGE
jgi:amino acid adenylation domain-containing protein